MSIRHRQRLHLMVNTMSFEEPEMSKFRSITIAAVLFVPIALAVLWQAAHIVA